MSSAASHGRLLQCPGISTGQASSPLDRTGDADDRVDLRPRGGVGEIAACPAGRYPSNDKETRGTRPQRRGGPERYDGRTRGSAVMETGSTTCEVRLHRRTQQVLLHTRRKSTKRRRIRRVLRFIPVK